MAVFFEPPVRANMVQRISAQIGLLAFASAIIVGLWVSNSFETTLLRAIMIMLGSVIVAQFVLAGAKQVVREELQRRKLNIDRAHVSAVRAAEQSSGPEVGDAASTSANAAPSSNPEARQAA